MLELITGRSGRAHIGSEDMRAYNAATFGDGRYALSDLTADIQDANTININPVELLVDGAHVRITAPGEVVTIESGITGSKRIDVVALHYYVDDSEGNSIEVMELVVVKGEYNVDSPVMPSMPTSGSILEGASDTHIPIMSVLVDGLTPQTPSPLVSREDSIAEKIMNVEKAIGVLQPDHGGTGNTSLKDAANAMINALPVGTSAPNDDDYIVSQYTGGGETNTTYYRRSASHLWGYIKSKITGGISGAITINFSAGRAIVSNSNGKLVSSKVTSDEIGYLDGLKSNAQKQLNSKQDKEWTLLATVTGTSTKTFTIPSDANELMITGSYSTTYTSSIVIRKATITSTERQVYLGGVWTSSYSRGGGVSISTTMMTGYLVDINGNGKEGTYKLYAR